MPDIEYRREAYLLEQSNRDMGEEEEAYLRHQPWPYHEGYKEFQGADTAPFARYGYHRQWDKVLLDIEDRQRTARAAMAQAQKRGEPGHVCGELWGRWHALWQIEEALRRL